MLDFTVGRGRASFGIQSTRRANRGSGAVLITAINTPSGQMFEGDLAEHLPLFSDYDSAGNYASTGGNILPPDYQLNNSTALGSTVTAEGDLPRWLISDDGGNSRAFPLPVVQWLLNILNVGVNQAEIAISPIAPDDKDLGDIVFPSGPYAATYTGVTTSDIRNGPYNFVAADDTGRPSISGTTGLGETLTVNEGFWHTPDGTTLSFSYQWQSNGTNISGANSATFDITASEQGTDVTCVVTGNDGTNSTPAETAATAIPAATPLITVAQLGTTKAVSGINGTADTGTFSCGDPAAGKVLVLQWAYGLRFGNQGDNTIDVIVDGGAGTILNEYQHESNKFTLTQFTIVDASAGGDIDISAYPNDPNVIEDWNNYVRRAYLVSGHSNLDFTFADVSGSGTMDLTDDVVNGGYVIGGSRASADANTNNTIVGLTIDSTHQHGGTQPSWLFSAEPTTTETRTMSISHDASTGFNTASILVVS